MRRRLYAFFALALGVANLSAGPVSAPEALALSPAFLALPSIDARPVLADGASVRVGDLVTFSFTLPEGANAQTVSVPEGVDLGEAGWQINAEVQREKSGSLTFSGRPIKAGTITLPTLALMNAKESVVRTNPVSLQVVSAISKDDPKPDQPENIRPPAKLPYPWWVAAVLTFLGVLAFVFLAYSVWRFVKSRRLSASALPDLPPRPEDEVAVAELDDLLKQGWLTTGAFKKHYFKASEILKNYIGKRYEFDAPEQTSSELVLHLETHRLVSDKLIDQIESLFERMDRVKFTDHVPPSEEGVMLVKEIRDFVSITRRLPSITPVLDAGGRVK
jgi:hypothetical protein